MYTGFITSASLSLSWFICSDQARIIAPPGAVTFDHTSSLTYMHNTGITNYFYLDVTLEIVSTGFCDFVLYLVLRRLD